METIQRKDDFRPDFFPPIDIPVIPPHTIHSERKHSNTTWEFMNEVCAIIKKEKSTSGVYEPSNSSYRLRWFCVLKKEDGTSFAYRFTVSNHLNHINYSSIQEYLRFQKTPCRSSFGRSFMWCNARTYMFGYDEVTNRSNHPRGLYKLFQNTLMGALQTLSPLPMGWTNFSPYFSTTDVTYHILQPENPTSHHPLTSMNVPVKGPKVRATIQEDWFVRNNSTKYRNSFRLCLGKTLLSKLELHKSQRMKILWKDLFSGQEETMALLCPKFWVIGH